MVIAFIREIDRSIIYPTFKDASMFRVVFMCMCERASEGPVAQLGERLVCIQEVVGSNPVGSTSLQRWEAKGAYSSVWLERTPDKREVGGSNPPRPTTICRKAEGISI